MHDIENLDVQGDLVFGTRRDWISEEFLGYFILDTQLQVAWVTSDGEEWSQQLRELGVTQTNLRWPGVNFNGFSIWSVITPIVIILCMIVALLWFIMQFAKHERQIRQDHLDRL